MRRRALVSGATVVAVLLIGSCSSGNPPSATTPERTDHDLGGRDHDERRAARIERRGHPRHRRRHRGGRLPGPSAHGSPDRHRHPRVGRAGRAGPVLRDRGVLVHDGPTGGRARAVAVRRRADRSVRPHPRVRVARGRAVQRDPGAARATRSSPPTRPNVRYVDRFRAAQREARSAGRGVWGRCVHEGACDPAYPDACIPPPPPDLDCSNIDERRFTVLPPDPHNFDGDHNGIGCERCERGLPSLRCRAGRSWPGPAMESSSPIARAYRSTWTSSDRTLHLETGERGLGCPHPRRDTVWLSPSLRRRSASDRTRRRVQGSLDHLGEISILLRPRLDHLVEEVLHQDHRLQRGLSHIGYEISTPR